MSGSGPSSGPPAADRFKLSWRASLAILYCIGWEAGKGYAPTGGPSACAAAFDPGLRLGNGFSPTNMGFGPRPTLTAI
jgi:hypothetical protein